MDHNVPTSDLEQPGYFTSEEMSSRKDIGWLYLLRLCYQFNFLHPIIRGIIFLGHTWSYLSLVCSNSARLPNSNRIKSQFHRQTRKFFVWWLLLILRISSSPTSLHRQRPPLPFTSGAFWIILFHVSESFNMLFSLSGIIYLFLIILDILSYYSRFCANVNPFFNMKLCIS